VSGRDLPGEEVRGTPRVVSGDHLELVVQEARRGWQRYPAVVLTADDERFWVELAVRTPPSPGLRPGLPVLCRLRSQTAILAWTSLVLEAGRGRLTLSLPANHRRLQRRLHARVDTAVPVTFVALQDPDSHEARGVTADLGGGGLSLLTFHPLEPGCRLQLAIGLKPRTVEAEGRVVRVIHPPAPAEPGCYGIEFTRLAQSAQDAIYRHVFAEQALQRRMGLMPRGGRRR